MRRKSLLSLSYGKIIWVSASLALLAGCFATKAAIDPYSYAPKTQDALFRHKPQKELLVYDVSQGPLSLAELLDIALKNNPETRISWAKARVAAAQYGIAQSPDLPSLNSTYTYSRTRQLSGATPQFDVGFAADIYYLSTWGPQLQLSYTLLDFGQTRAQANAAKEALFQANYSHNRQIQTVIRNVTNDYYAYLYQIELLKAYEQDVQTAETTYKAAQMGLDAGVKNLSDVLQSQTQLLQNQIQLVNQRQNVVQSWASLLTTMGIRATEKLEVQHYPAVPPLEEMLANAEELVEAAFESRDDLLAAQANVESKKESVFATQQQFFPTLAYNLNFGQTSYSKVGSDRYDFTTTFSLNFPLFSGFSTLNSLKEAKAKQLEAEALVIQKQLEIVEDITVFHNGVKVAYDTVNYVKDLLEAAHTQYDVALARYKAGTADILEVVSAQSTLANARAQNASSINAWFSSLVDLSYAAGTIQPPPPEETSMRRLVALLILAILASCGKPKNTSPSLPFVTTKEVTVRDMPIFLEYVGHVEANQTVNIRAQVSGILTGQYFVEGQTVRANETLLTIDDRPFLAALAQAEGALAQNLAKLKQAEDTRDRYAHLVKDNFVSQLDYDQFVTNVQSLQGVVQESYANVVTAKINLDYCTIQAPIDGVTSKLLINVGNYIPVGGQSLLSINQITPIKVQFNVPEKDLPKIARANLREPLKVRALLQKEQFEGQLSLIDNQVNINTGTLLLEAIFPNEELKLWPGEFVDLRIILDIKKNALVIPSQAVFLGQEGFYVYVIKNASLNNSEVELRPVVLSQKDGNEVIIEQGLHPHEIVVLDGQINLKPGMQVSVQKRS